MFDSDEPEVLAGRPRARSLSPPTRRSSWDEFSETRTFFQERFDKVVSSLEADLRSFLNRMTHNGQHTDDEATGFGFGYTHDRGLASEQLRLLATDLLRRAGSQERDLSGVYFQEVTENLGKLMHHCNPTDHTVPLIKDLLRLIAKPARLLECLEFDPVEHRSSNHNRLAAITSSNSHMPTYIQRKLTTHFGPTENAVFEDEEAMYRPADGALSPGTVFLGSDSAQPARHDFDFCKQLSAGAYGVVWLAKHHVTQESVAIKVMKKKMLINKNMVHQVNTEKDILQFARNPFLINLICSFTTKESLYIVMEYAPGGDLAAYLKAVGQMTEKEARQYFAEAVLAVEYIHDFGIIHRDLKPDNLVLSKDGHVKLTDFGLSKIGLMSQTTLMEEVEGGAGVDAIRNFKDSQVMGTPDYIAPEVITGQGYGPAVDWWSMGIILYEFLTGQPPFFGDTPQELFWRAVHQDVVWPEEEGEEGADVLSSEVKDIVSHLLEKSPERRLGSAAAAFEAYPDEAVTGAEHVQDHDWFMAPLPCAPDGIDWDNLLLQKASFVPVLDDELDTSYFDDRSDRYSYTLSSGSSEDSGGEEDMLSNSFRNFSCVNVQSPNPMSPTGPGSSRRRTISRPQSPASSPTMRRRAGSGSVFVFPEGETGPSGQQRPSSEQTVSPTSSQLGSPQSRRSSDHGKSKLNQTVSAQKTAAGSGGQEASPDSIPRLVLSTTSPEPEPEPSAGSRPSTANRLQRGKPFVVTSAGRPISLTPSTPTDSAESSGSVGGSPLASPTLGASLPLRSPRSKPRPLCLLGCKQCKNITLDPKEGLGFTLRCDSIRGGKRHLVWKVDSGSAAERAGMAPGQVIVQVNAVNTTGWSHQRVRASTRPAGFPVASSLVSRPSPLQGSLSRLCKALASPPCRPASWVFRAVAGAARPPHQKRSGSHHLSPGPREEGHAEEP